MTDTRDIRSLPCALLIHDGLPCRRLRSRKKTSDRPSALDGITFSARRCLPSSITSDTAYT